MPTLSVVRDDLFAALGKQCTEEEFDELCFEFGIELDEVTSEAKELQKEAGSSAGAEGASDAVIYKIDIPANRYDLLCVEGLARALRIFMGMESTPQFKIADVPQGQRQRMVVKPDTAKIRPHVVCAVLRGLKFDQKTYKSFIDLQDKLHQNVCRRRTLVAIGTHDLSTIQGPFTYDARRPQDIEFQPLTPADGRSFMAKDLLDFYNTDPSVKHLKPYTSIIYSSEVYPVILDSRGTVLSLPPVINGHHSRITLQTTDVFIECTATDLTKANIVLDTVVTMFAQYCTPAFTVEPVEVTYERDGRTDTTPSLPYRSEEARVEEICSVIGVQIDPQEICRLCAKMQLGPAEYLPSTGTVRVTVPPTRTDILHAVDIIEDVAIAYGFNKVPTTLPPSLTVGGPLAINRFADLLREEISRAGYTEMLTHGLCSRAENFKLLRRPEQACVSLSNPAITEYEVVRTTLLPGALKTVQFNRGMAVKEGIKLFEISDVVLPDASSDTGARNCRRLVATYTGMTAGFEYIHGLVDRVMALVQVEPARSYASSSLRAGASDSALGGPWRDGMEYYIKPSDDPAFFPGRCADVILVKGGETQRLGTFGILHPEVLKNYELNHPSSALELDLEPLL